MFDFSILSTNIKGCLRKLFHQRVYCQSYFHICLMLLEICANSIESALNAQNGGADRIELCSHLEADGLTPSHGLIKLTRELLQIPVFVLIRPRAGNFVYSKMEMELMKEDIRHCAEMRCDGVVIGCLNEDRTINEYQTAELLECASFLDVTFHKAFDQVPNPFEALETLKEIGIQRILTSGTAPIALEGLDMIGELIEEAEGEMIIMPGGGVRPNNLERLFETGATEYHSAAIPKNESTTSIEMVRELKRILQLAQK